ncbi:MAG: JAB domain-containing protein [Sediminibacterium sp.]|uniref:JAB domain-containing protein n=1 Tax=Sediminibacterium sp. TaxID=1917865 RepID=UPI002728B455|nr:JAB domain-containing protein [Sediminibacterium sp.]MDO8996512.1 JAB domain-containing protein [Sediminibacterium sp.]
MKKLIKTEVAEIEVSYRPAISDKPVITSCLDAYNVIKEFIPKNKIALKEYIAVIYLNRANRVIGAYRVSDGGMTSTVADLRLIFSVALKSVACSFIIAHNHPSGTLIPSVADKALTNKLKDAGKLMDIAMLDHIIIGPEEGKYFSFADEGLL